MVVRLCTLASIMRHNLTNLNHRHYSSKIGTFPCQFLIRRRLVSAASTIQQTSPSSSTNPPNDDKNRTDTQAKPVTVTFITADGSRHTVHGKEGDSLLDVVIDKQVPLDGYGACEGTLACSTCHVVLQKRDYDRLPDKPSDEELDMLDLAYGLSDTSRLGCQIILTKEFEGLEVTVPAGTYDARSN